jgi:hypothetical protein
MCSLSDSVKWWRVVGAIFSELRTERGQDGVSKENASKAFTGCQTSSQGLLNLSQSTHDGVNGRRRMWLGRMDRDLGNIQILQAYAIGQVC